jgi:hypothetical protein
MHHDARALKPEILPEFLFKRPVIWLYAQNIGLLSLSKALVIYFKQARDFCPSSTPVQPGSRADTIATCKYTEMFRSSLKFARKLHSFREQSLRKVVSLTLL